MTCLSGCRCWVNDLEQASNHPHSLAPELLLLQSGETHIISVLRRALLRVKQMGQRSERSKVPCKCENLTIFLL